MSETITYSGPGAGTSAANRRFALHYIEMVVVMVLGMIVLGAPLGMVVDINGTGPMLVEMAATMTVPMIAWMRFRGHAWRPCVEMTASMVLPTLGALALLGSGLVEGAGALMIIEHAVMLPAMFVAMLLRHEEYSCHHGAHREVTAEGRATSSLLRAWRYVIDRPLA